MGVRKDIPFYLENLPAVLVSSQTLTGVHVPPEALPAAPGPRFRAPIVKPNASVAVAVGEGGGGDWNTEWGRGGGMMHNCLKLPTRVYRQGVKISMADCSVAYQCFNEALTFFTVHA